jgi:hypothetical protein
MSRNRRNRFSGARSRRSILGKCISNPADKIRVMFCPQHGAPPGITSEGGAFSVVTCCDPFKKEVLLVLAEVMQTTH